MHTRRENTCLHTYHCPFLVRRLIASVYSASVGITPDCSFAVSSCVCGHAFGNCGCDVYQCVDFCPQIIIHDYLIIHNCFARMASRTHLKHLAPWSIRLAHSVRGAGQRVQIEHSVQLYSAGAPTTHHPPLVMWGRDQPQCL